MAQVHFVYLAFAIYSLIICAINAWVYFGHGKHPQATNTGASNMTGVFNVIATIAAIALAVISMTCMLGPTNTTVLAVSAVILIMTGMTSTANAIIILKPENNSELPSDAAALTLSIASAIAALFGVAFLLLPAFCELGKNFPTPVTPIAPVTSFPSPASRTISINV